MPEENFDDSLDINTIEFSIRITFFNADRYFGLFFRKYYYLAWWEKAVLWGKVTYPRIKTHCQTPQLKHILKTYANIA